MFNPNNIMKIEFIQTYGNIEIEMIALYNNTITTEKEAQQAIKLYGMGENQFIIFMTKEQFNNIFMK